jgi:hypothetical protein
MSPAATTTGYLPESRRKGRPDGSAEGSQAPAATATTTTVTMDVQRADADIDGVGQALAREVTAQSSLPVSSRPISMRRISAVPAPIV